MKYKNITKIIIVYLYRLMYMTLVQLMLSNNFEDTYFVYCLKQSNLKGQISSKKIRIVDIPEYFESKLRGK